MPQIFCRHYPAYLSDDLNMTGFAWVCDLNRNAVYKYFEILEK